MKSLASKIIDNEEELEELNNKNDINNNNYLNTEGGGDIGDIPDFSDNDMEVVFFLSVYVRGFTCTLFLAKKKTHILFLILFFWSKTLQKITPQIIIQKRRKPHAKFPT